MDTFEENPAEQFVSPGVISTASNSIVDELALDPRFQELQSTLRTYLFDEVRSAECTRQQTPDNAEESAQELRGHKLLVQHLRKSVDGIPLARKLKYLNTWISECAPWLDMFDQERHFGVHVPILAQRSASVFFALLALAARQVERKSGAKSQTQDSLELYSQAISSLVPSINARDPEVLVTACILCVLEMMSVSPRDWRRHSEGCAALFEHLGVNGFSGGLLQAVFWCYARMDLCAAIIADGAETTTLPIQKWAIVDTLPVPFPDQQMRIHSEFLQRGVETADMYANYAVYLCARVCDLLAQRTRYLELGEENGCNDSNANATWADLKVALQRWFDQRPPQMLPVQELEASAAIDSFPRLLFAQWAAISGNQLYHTACILLSEIQLSHTNAEPSLSARDALWHARRIVGISLTNHHRGCLNNAIQPLYVAGKLFTHRDEHRTVVNLLHHIEACSGWGSKWRIKDLETFWGHRYGRNTQTLRP